VSGIDTQPAATPTPETEPFGADIRRLLSSSGTYMIADGVSRLFSVLLLPVYSRAMPPSDYGVLAVCLTVFQLLVFVMSLGITQAIARLHFDHESEADRKTLYGTILGFLLTGTLAIALLLDLGGRTGVFDLIPSVPYRPYLELTLWAAYLSLFLQVPLNVFTTRQRPRAAAALMLAQVVLQAGLTVVFVVVLDRQAEGALLAILLCYAVMAVVSLALCVRMAAPRISRGVLRSALAFSIPLIPHSIASWVLFLSDRAVLERFVSTTELGVFSIGYAVGTLSMLATFGISRAIQPMIFERLIAGGAQAMREVRELGTYAMLLLIGVCLANAVFGGDVVRVLTPPEYHDAARIVPWVVAGYLCFGVYTLGAQGLFFAKRTGRIAAGTGLAGVASVGLNFLLIPPLGIDGAAITCFLAFLALALLQYHSSQSVYRIDWDIGRWARAIAIGTALGLPFVLTDAEGVLAVVAKVVVVFVAYPALLLAAQVVDLQGIRSIVRR
jgi:O-antigen/teichoic acid export membrane protein